MRWLVTLALALAVPTWATADVPRPQPRPAAVERLAAFAGASALAPQRSLRPLRPAAGAGVEAGVGPAADPAAAAGIVAGMDPGAAPTGPAAVPEPAAPASRALSGPAAAPDPVPDPARRLAATRAVTVSLSSSAARAPVFLPASGLAPLRPRGRPEASAAAVAAPPALPLRPRMRPEGLADLLPAAFAAAPRAPAAAALAAPAMQAMVSPRPAVRPRGLAERAARSAGRAPAPDAAPEREIRVAVAPRIAPGEALVKPRKGALCGDAAIKGATLPPITSAVQGCGIKAPVQVTEVDGVRLSVPATLDCDTARALRQWVSSGLKPAAGKAGVSEIRVAAHYACRGRNNVRGARISEHGRGKAIDIAGIRLGDGRTLTVLGDYRSSRMLQQVRKAACGIFGTTLGPGSDRYHSDHFHFDTARHRNGAYCR